MIYMHYNVDILNIIILFICMYLKMKSSNTNEKIIKLVFEYSFY